MATIYGYVRVSTKDQNEARQLLAMDAFGVESKNVIVEKQSGKDFERPKYKWLIRHIKKDDTLVIKSIDRLGRNYEEIIEQWRMLRPVRIAFCKRVHHAAHHIKVLILNSISAGGEVHEKTSKHMTEFAKSWVFQKGTYGMLMRLISVQIACRLRGQT